MLHTKRSILAFMMALAILISSLATPSAARAYGGYPTFSITAVVADKTVTIQAYNFPANDSFTVLMGAYGTLGINGTVVATQTTGAGGSFTATYDIPSGLKGAYQIAIRLESPTSGYYAYNWFYNNTASVPPTSGTGGGYPYFNISAVVRNKTVTILAYNFPAKDSFTVRMGAYGTLGVGGTVVGTQDSGAGGSFTATYTIPAGLANADRIAIRLESAASGYYAYNWFYNNTYP